MAELWINAAGELKSHGSSTLLRELLFRNNSYILLSLDLLSLVKWYQSFEILERTVLFGYLLLPLYLGLRPFLLYLKFALILYL